MKKAVFAIILSALSLAAVSGREFALVKDGKAVSCIVLDGYEQTEADAYAAVELADYLEKITGARVQIRQDVPKGVYPIYIGKAFRKKLPAKFKNHWRKVRPDGYFFTASPQGAYIYSSSPVGVIYGAYELLKRYGNVRWFFPGEDGEYIEKKKNFTIPETAFTDNPAMVERTFNHVGANIRTDQVARKWLLRNKMTVKGKFGAIRHGGGHVFSNLLPDIYFKEKPELYGLYNGKRVPQCGDEKLIYRNGGRGGQKNQPCTSNAETRRIMRDNMIKMIATRSLTSFNIMNNDSNKWCECENCRKLDTAEDRKSGSVSTRFWHLANYLIAEAKKVFPSLQISCSAYQNYQTPPTGIKSDKRATILFCVHHRCYTHSIDDLSCRVNDRTRKILQAWRKAGHRVATYEYTNMLPAFDIYYLPLEKLVADDIKYYASRRGYGYCDEVPPKDAYYGRARYNTRKMREFWRGSFLTRYMQAYFMWAPKADFEKVMEDIGSKFYTKAWKEMKEYRRLLRENYAAIPAHFMYGTGRVALGMVLEKKGLKAKLLSLLAEAEKKAKGDEILLKRIQFEKEYFLLSFVKSNDLYAKQQSTPCVAEKISSPVKIDGVLDDACWKKAKVVTDFQIFNAGGKLADPQSRARVAWDEKYLYIALEAMEKDMDKVVASCVKNDENVWMDNCFELFFAPPSFCCSYIHWAVNHKGIVYDTKSISTKDSSLKFNLKADKKVAVLKDRWIVEMCVPFSELGGAPEKGERWAINIARGRKVFAGQKKISQISSWSHEGRFHGAEGFRKILFK